MIITYYYLLWLFDSFITEYNEERERDMSLVPKLPCSFQILDIHINICLSLSLSSFIYR
jgi:hypothetical protein